MEKQKEEHMEICGSWNREIAKPKREMVSADISEERIQGSHDHDFPATSVAQKVRAINRVVDDRGPYFSSLLPN